MKLVNLGCGGRFHDSWSNFDFVSHGDSVIAHNLYESLPLDDASVDVVYSSHVLEHFPKRYAVHFLRECFRVLKKDGVLRIVVPDLEQIVRNYLHFLELSKGGDRVAEAKYDWTMLELFDQMVRNQSGGEMLEYWRQSPMPEEDFVVSRVGSEVRQVLGQIRSLPSPVAPTSESRDAKKIGEFRVSGEAHLWMYDSFSLERLLRDAGFHNVKRTMANESRISNFNSYLLDIEPDGSVRKPDSLFMECQR